MKHLLGCPQCLNPHVRYRTYRDGATLCCLECEWASGKQEYKEFLADEYGVQVTNDADITIVRLLTRAWGRWVSFDRMVTELSRLGYKADSYYYNVRKRLEKNLPQRYKIESNKARGYRLVNLRIKEDK